MEDQLKETAIKIVDGSITQKLLVCQHCGLELPPGSRTCPQHGPVSGAEDLLIKELGSRYEFISLVSTGGMGVIYKAKQLLLNKTVAIKMLHSHLASEQSLARFQQEAMAASTLEHPGIIRVHDFGISEHGQAFMVMDFVEGKTLGQLIEEQGQIETKMACQIFIQVCEAAEQAHSKGILHRDLKPSNIMISYNPDGSFQAKLVDFGIAKIQDQVRLTQTGDVIGSPPYMSPEQCRGQNIDHRSDIYSLGCVMYETLTGQPPHTGESLMEIIFKQLNEKAIPISKVRPELKFPSALAQIVETTLEKDPKDRYQSITKIRNDLEKLFKSRFSISYINRKQRTYLTGLLAITILFWAGTIALINLNNNVPLGISKMTSAELSNLARSKYIRNLDLVNSIVDNHPFGDRDLYKIRRMKSLEVLNLRWTKVSDDGLAHLTNLRNLKELRLSTTGVRGPGLAHLKSLPRLTALSLSNLKFSPGGLASLSELKQLKELHISQAPLTNENLEDIAKLEKLESLEIKSAGITDDTIGILTQLKRLKSLNVAFNKIGDKSVSQLVALQDLYGLDLSSTEVTDEGILQLKQLPRLQRTRITGTRVTMRGMERLRKVKPNLQFN